MEYNITYRKKDKGWQYIINVKTNGRWKYAGSKQGFSTRGLAKAAADEHVERLKEKAEIQEETSPEYKDITFKQLVEIYKKHKSLHQTMNTVRSFEGAILHFKSLDDKTVINITPLDVQSCVDNMIEQGLSMSSIKLYISIIKTFFNFAISPYKIIKYNPINDIRISKTHDGLRKNLKVKALSKSELEDLLSKISFPKYYIASLLASKCGLRLGEILGLTWDRIDMKTAMITIDRQWKELSKNEWGFGLPKSDNSCRVVPAPAVVIGELEKYKKQYPLHISGRILPYASTKNFGSTLRECYRSIGYDISVHDLRHTYATTLIANGLDFKTVAKLMGHDVEETIRTYSHVTSDMFDNATKIINSIF